MPYKDEKCKNIMPVHEVSRLLQLSQSLIRTARYKKSLRIYEDAIMIELILLVGLRSSEITNLKISECLVGVQKRFIDVSRQKGGGKRSVEIPFLVKKDLSMFFNWLKEKRGISDGQYVLRSERGEKLAKPSTIYRRWKKHTSFNLQQGRASYAKGILESTSDAAFLKKQMGLSRNTQILYYTSDEVNGTNKQALEIFSKNLFSARPVKDSNNEDNSEKTDGDIESPGLVYVVRASSQYKIGYTNNLQMRIKQLQCCCPHKIETIITISSENAEALEHELHIMFREKRLFGEWFSLSDHDLLKIVSLYRSQVTWSSIPNTEMVL